MSRPIYRDPDSPYIVLDLRDAGGSIEHATAYGPASLDRAAELERTIARQFGSDATGLVRVCPIEQLSDLLSREELQRELEQTERKAAELRARLERTGS